MIVGTLLPPDQDGGFLGGDLGLHAPIISETAQEIHEKYGFVSCQPYITNRTFDYDFEDLPSLKTENDFFP